MPLLLGRALLLAAVGYFLVCLFVFFRQRTMLYYPQSIPGDQMAREAREVGMTRWMDQDGNPLGWMTSGDSAAIPVIIFQGNSGNALGRMSLIENLRGAGATGRIHVAEYPGYGSAPGNPSQKSLTELALRAVEALPGRPIVVGESLGTGVASQAAARLPEKIRGMILITPFDSMVSAAAHHYPWLPVQLLLIDRFDSVRALKNFPNPVAIVLGEQDETTPPEGGRRLFSGLPGPKKLWEAKGAGHNDAASSLKPAAWRDIWMFVSSP